MPTFTHADHVYAPVPLGQALAEKPDCVVITTDHDVYDYADIAARASLVVDTRNALRDHPAPHIFKL